MAENINIDFMPNRKTADTQRVGAVEDYLKLFTDRAKFCFSSIYDELSDIGKRLDSLDDFTISTPSSVDLVVENAVILQEHESQQVIHNFTKTHYVDGNTIGYGDVSNKIVVCGYNFLYIPTLYIGTAVDTYYSVVEFPTVRSRSKTVNWSNYKVEARLMTVNGTGRKTYEKVVSYIDENGTERTYYYDSLSTDGFCALVPVWDNISSAVDGLEYGYALVDQIHFVAIKDGIVVNSENFAHRDSLYISFSSEAEYNAAVGLTNTPIELIEIQDFQYLVPESQIIVDKELSPDSDNTIANSTVAKALELKADKETVETLSLVVESKADIIELEALSQKVDSKADITTVSALSEAVDGKAEKSEVQSIAQAVEGKAESSDLMAHTGNTANPHSVTKAQIGLNKVENKSSADILSELNFIGENILDNATFHSNFAKWHFTNNNFSEITVKDGFPCAHFSGGIGKSTSVRQSVLEEIDKENLDQLYTFSADIRLDDYVAGTTNPFARLYFSATYDNNGTSSAFNATTVAGSPDMSQYSGQGWQKVYWTVRFARVPNSIYAFVYARDFTGELYFKNLKLEKGSVPTAYTPSVMDYTELVDRVAVLEAALLSLGGEI